MGLSDIDAGKAAEWFMAIIKCLEENPVGGCLFLAMMVTMAFMVYTHYRHGKAGSNP